MSKKTIIILILVLLVAGAIIYFDHRNQTPEKEIKNFADCVAAGHPVMESYPRQCSVPNGGVFVEEIKTNNQMNEDAILVTKPSAGASVSSPVEIEGQARGFWFFEASFPIEIQDKNGQVIGTGIAQAQSDWMTENYVAFKASIQYIVDKPGEGKIVLKRDNPSGLSENDASFIIPIKYAANNKIKLKVFFQNSELDAATDYDCSKFLAVDREVSKTEAVARAALEELLKGPTPAEADLGFTTTIPAGVKIQKLTIENGVAKVDFSSDLENGVGGSCRVSAIRAQINETLKQFSTVSSVVISINGRTEDILQP